jgi:outer membrane protein OmpA-like peptidoglycan-associated protein
VRTSASSLALVGAIALLSSAPAAAGTTPSPSSSSVTGGGAELPATVTTTDGVEVTTYGTVPVAVDNRGQESRVFQALHGVRRLPDVTVVYWSLGWQQEPWLCCDLFGPFGASVSAQEIFAGTISPTFISLALPEQGQLLTGTPDVTRRFGTQPTAASTTDALPDEPGVMAVMFSVLPPLPEDVDTVDVTLGNASLLTDVPVEEGLLEPVAEGPVVPLGTGWPEVPEELLAPLRFPAVSVRPLVAVAERVDGTSGERTADDEVTLDLAADVLFAFDSAALGPAAQATLDRVAKEVRDRAAPGALTVTGHTDDRGEDAYNDRLSRARADAVAAALRPRLAGTALQLQVDAKGEREPVADNGDERGRQQNRRVSVTFTEQEGAR